MKKMLRTIKMACWWGLVTIQLQERGRQAQAKPSPVNIVSSQLTLIFGDHDGVLSDSPVDSVVKVMCLHSRPNYSLPWQRKRLMSTTCNGYIIDNMWIIINTHSIRYHARIKLKKGSYIKYKATVLAIGHDCDLGFPVLGFEWQDMENPDLRMMGMRP